MHTDEAINAYVTGQVLAGGAYQYDPVDRHGPALYAVSVPLARLAGAKTLSDLTETTVRMGPILTGSLAVLLFIPWVAELSLPVAWLAALLWVIAALPVYYSRYFIHETMFVAATLGLLGCGWRWLRSGSLVAAALGGFWAALMVACKETAVLNFAAAGMAGGWWFLQQRGLAAARLPGLLSISNGIVDQPTAGNREDRGAAPALLRWPGLALGVFVALLLLVALFSWGGKNWRGVADLMRAVPHLLARAGGQGHEKAWWYYLQLLAGGWSGWALLAFAAAGAAAAIRKGVSGPLMFWLIYAVAIFLLYSIIPYKTPWLALNLFLPLAILAAAGAAGLWNFLRALNLADVAFAPTVVVGAGILCLLGHDTWLRVYRYPADYKNPYAYAHTGEDLERLPERLAQLVGPQTVIAVVSDDPWPLPWYLRKLHHVGYWRPGQNPGRADIFLTSPEAAQPMAARLAHWRWEYFGVRPGVLLLLWTPPAR